MSVLAYTEQFLRVGVYTEFLLLCIIRFFWILAGLLLSGYRIGISYDTMYIGHHRIL